VKRSQNFLSLGIMLILLGVALLVISSGGFENGVFFIFPFFFFSASEPTGIFFILGFIVIIVVIMMRTTSTFFDQSDATLSVESKCVFCTQTLPENASFCPKCGNSVDYDTMSNTNS